MLFGRPFVKRFALCYRSVVCLPVCLSVCLSATLVYCGQTVGRIKMKLGMQTWHAGRPRPWPHCVRWGPSSPPIHGHSPKFSAHICCDQMAAWIKMSLGTEVGLGPGDFVLDGDPDAPPPKGHRPQFSAISVAAEWLHGSRCRMVWS